MGKSITTKCVRKETLKERNKRGLYHRNEIQCFPLRKLNFLLPLLALCRCGEEEEPSVWVCHTTGRLRGWFTSKARGELFVQANVLLMESGRCGQLIEKKQRKFLLQGMPMMWMPVCFASCQQAIVLEGSYWKRRIEVVIKEYHKWRIYHKKRVSSCFFPDHKWNVVASTSLTVFLPGTMDEYWFVLLAVNSY